jgi:hypothetical protein
MLFLSVKLAEESQELVSFVVPHGQFSFTSLCAGLNLAPAVYSQLGSEILGGHEIYRGMELDQ